jgi:hypothetical protein
MRNRAPMAKRDQIRINSNEESDLEEWSQEFGVSPEMLKAAISMVGPLVADLERELAKPL